MSIYIALFRGINVGGRNLLPMRELVPLFEALGMRNVRTYIQSGNVVFEGDKADAARLSDQIGAAVKKSHGFAPHLIILESEELTEAIASNPYPEAESDPKTVHLTFLSSVPENPDLESLERIKRDSERFMLEGKVFYLHAPEGIARSKLATRIEKSLGVAGTARNWRTVCAIEAMAAP
ncbi:MAG: DUF1697 domain-containing protein [Pseudomonadales bacterium]